MREALNLALDQALAKDESVFLMGEDIADEAAGGIVGVTAGLSTKYGHDRVFDTPISEAAIVGAAIGAALDGRRPVVEIMIMDFIGIALDQIVNHAAKMRFMTAGRTDVADHGAHGGVGRHGHRRDALAVARELVHGHPGPQGRDARARPPTPRVCSPRRSSTTTPSCSSRR